MTKRIIVLVVLALTLFGAALPTLLAAGKPTVTASCVSGRLRLTWANFPNGISVYNMTTYRKYRNLTGNGAVTMPWTGRYAVMAVIGDTAQIVRSWQTNCPAGRP
jgi:hypothetical protein